MKKEHSVFITFSPIEVEEILDKAARKSGILKDVPKGADCKLFDDVDICVEYRWEE